MNTKTVDPLAQLMDAAAFDHATQEGMLVVQGDGGGGSLPQSQRSGLITGVHGDVFTAQRVAQNRSMTNIMARLKAIGQAAGKDWVYGWEVNDRKNNRKVWIEGPTIKLANDLAREYGNCMVDCRVRDEGANWVFYGRFMDLETGYALVRAYQQRKNQGTGMKDDQRALDMVFQIGQSKCIRNVIVNALQTLADFCVDAAKSGLLERVGKNPTAAREWIVGKLKALSIDQKRVEAIYGRTAEHWTVPDMARIYTEIQSIIDGMQDAADVYPTGEQAKQSDAPKEPTRKKAGDENPPTPPAGQPTGANGHGHGPDPKEDRVPTSAVPAGSIVHFFNSAKRPLGSLPYRPAIAVGKEIALNEAQVRVVELQGTDNPLVWVAEVADVAAEAKAPANAEGVGNLMDQADTAITPAAPKPRGRPKKAIDFGELA